MDYTPIGRVRPIHRGTHDPYAAYEALDVVRRADGLASYMAKQAVPAGETLEDGEYWGLLSDAGVKAVADAACVPFEAGGSVAECHPVAGYPLEVRSDIEPVQSGAGDPSPDNVRPITGRTGAKLTRCGKNLMNPMMVHDGDDVTVGADGSITINNTSATDRMYVWTGWTNIPAGTYTLKAYFDAVTECYLQQTESDYSHLIDGNTSTLTFAEDTQVRILFAVNASTKLTYRVQLEQGSAATAYTPYTGDTYAADFGQTVYGGTLDWNTGVLTVDRAMMEFNGAENWSISSNNIMFMLQDIYGFGYDVPCISNHFKTIKYADGDSGGFGINITEVIRAYTTSMFTTVDAWKSYLAAQYAAGTPVQVVYRLATPTTIQLTPQEVAALEGLNTLYSSTGDTAVAGRADMGWVTQSIMDRLAALESAALSE